MSLCVYAYVILFVQISDGRCGYAKPEILLLLNHTLTHPQTHTRIGTDIRTRTCTHSRTHTYLLTRSLASTRSRTHHTPTGSHTHARTLSLACSPYLLHACFTRQTILGNVKSKMDSSRFRFNRTAGTENDELAYLACVVSRCMAKRVF